MMTEKTDNPIYQGQYTIYDLRREREAGISDSPEATAFIQRIVNVYVKSGRDRWERIKSEAKDRYNGPTQWKTGIIEDFYSIDFNFTPLDYYREYYDLSDEDAVIKRLETYDSYAQMMDDKDRIYDELNAIVTERYPELIESVEQYTALAREVSLFIIKDSEMVRDALIKIIDHMGDYSRVEWGPLIRDSIEEHQRNTDTLDRIIKLGDYDELKAGPYSYIVHEYESELSEDNFIAYCEPFRIAYGGDYHNFIVRMVRASIFNSIVWYAKDPTETLKAYSEGERIDADQLKEWMKAVIVNQKDILGNLEEYREYVKASDDKLRAISERMSTRYAGMLEPPIQENNVFISHSQLSRVGYSDRHILEKNPDMIQLQIADDGKTYREIFQITVNRGKGIQLQGHIDGVGGRQPNARHKQLMDTIASMFIAKYGDDYESMLRGGYIDPTAIELCRRARRQPEAEIGPKDLKELQDDMQYLMGSLYNDDVRDIMDHNPFFARLIKLFDPDAKGRLKHPLIYFIMHENEDNEGRIYWRYRIVLFPIIPLLDYGLGMSSSPRYAVIDTPRIWLDDIPPHIQPFIIGMFDANGKKIKEGLETSGIHLLNTSKGKDPKPYIPYMKIKEASQIMNIILSEVETHDKYDTTDRKGYFDFNIAWRCEDIWHEEYQNSTSVMKTKMRLHYLRGLYRLWIMDYKVKGLTVLTKGRGWDYVRVYLRDPKEGLESVPAIMKDPMKYRDPYLLN